MCSGAATQSVARSAPPLVRGTWAEIDLAAVSANVRSLRDMSPGSRFMAVVKADAYGHGSTQVARTAIEAGADWLGVALVEEGLALRSAGIAHPILVLSEPPVAAIPAIVESELTPTVYSPTFLAALDAHGRTRSTPVTVHLKLDTGMGRVGAPEGEWSDLFRAAVRARGLDVEGLWSHLATAEVAEERFTDLQAIAFSRGVDLARRSGLRPRLLHLCNSAGAQLRPDLHYDLVRTGLAMYGLQPVPGVTSPAELRPAMALYTRLTQVKRVSGGTPVGYGTAWVAPQDTVLGTVAAGYGDGVRRGLTGVGQAIHRGRRVEYAGTVCMDQTVLDLGPCSPAAPGDEVVLLGGRGSSAVTAEDWADWLGTIAHEVVCSIGARVPRVHIGRSDGASTSAHDEGAALGFGNG